MSLRLIIEDFEGDRMVVPLPEDEGPVTLGRAADNHVRLPERNVSRRHAELHPSPDGWLLLDADSYNGVLVNGEVVEGDRKLEVGDFIVLADYQLLLGSQAHALEQDVAALATASRQRKQALLDSQDSTEVAEILPSTFPSAADALGAPASAISSPLYDDEEQSGSRSKQVMWVAGALGVVGVAALLTLNMGDSASGPTASKDAVAAADLQAKNSPVAKASPTPVLPAAQDADPKAAPQADAGTQAKPDAAAPANPVEKPAAQTDKPDSGTAAVPSGNAGTPAKPAQQNPPAQDQAKAAASSKQGPDASAKAARARKERESARNTREQAKQLIKRARKAAMSGRHQEAMTLARRSFRAQATQDSLQILGLSACKVPNRGLAEFAFNRLRRGESRRILVKLCGDAGIKLD